MCGRPAMLAKPASVNTMYGRRDYWEDRYSDGVVGCCHTKGVQSNEWYLEYPALQGLLTENLSKAGHVLILGNGLSLLAEDMAADGFENILAVDYSETCIWRMQKQQKCRQSSFAVMYKLMDVTALQLQDCTYDAVVDKATLDCLMNCKEWQGKVHAMLTEAHRVLHLGGKFICISHSGPEDRLQVLLPDLIRWNLLRHLVVPKNKVGFHAYVFEKTA